MKYPLTILMLALLLLPACASRPGSRVSEKTLADVQAFISPEMSVDQLGEFLGTRPSLSDRRELRWTLSDGQLWTGFRPTSRGLIITDAVGQPTPETPETPEAPEARDNQDEPTVQADSKPEPEPEPEPAAADQAEPEAEPAKLLRELKNQRIKAGTYRLPAPDQKD
ncbi:MAG: hypothetical protein ACLFVN_10235 [Phycisphaeraceae bacterium]